MGKAAKYLKRGFKYVTTESKQPIVKVEVVQKKPQDLFKGKSYIITGGGSGLGFSIAENLAKNGAKVIITGRNEEKLKKSCDSLGKNASYKVCDMQDVDSVIKMIDECCEKNAVDGIVNNAGVSLHEWDFLKVTKEGYDSQFETNLRGSYFATQEYIRIMLDKKLGGNVLFISSEAGTMCDDLPYGLTKRAIDSLTEALSFKYYKQGIRVNAIAPGVTATEMTKIDVNSDLYSANTSGRIFVPEEVAETALFLLSDNSKCVSGQIIHTNGGNHIKRRY